MVRDAGAKMFEAILLEIARLEIARPLDEAEQAFFDDLGRQAMQIGLKRIAREHTVRKYARFALDRHQRITEQLTDQRLGVGIAQMQPVAGFIEAKALALVGLGRSEERRVGKEGR